MDRRGPTAQAPAVKLNIGSGNILKRGYVNLDVMPHPGLQVCADLRQYPHPFADDSFDEVLSDHVIAHLDSFHNTLMELVRITKDRGRIVVKASYFPSTKWFGDPDHKIPFGYRTFDGYTKIVGKPKWHERWKLEHATNYGAGYPLIMEKRWFVFDNLKAIRWIGHIINLAPLIYDRFFCHWLPAMEVCYVLQVDKRHDPHQVVIPESEADMRPVPVAAISERDYAG